MKNLDKVWSVWEDLDKAYSHTKVNPSVFLKSLVSYGKSEDVMSLLAKIAGDIEDADDNRKYKYIRDGMFVLLNAYDLISDDIVSLNSYINSLINSGLIDYIPFEDIIKMVSNAKPYFAEGYDFDESPVGVEYITASSIHKVKLASKYAVIVPSWVSNIKQLNLAENNFYKKVIEEFKNLKSNVKKPVVFISKEAKLNNKVVMKKKNKSLLTCGDISVEVICCDI